MVIQYGMTISPYPIQQSDRGFLREMLCQAVFVSPYQEPYDRSILDLPEVSKYIANRGSD